VGVAPGALTARQLEIAALVAEGDSNKEIAAALSVTSGTVSNHIERILDRLGLRNRAHLAAWYARQDAGQDGRP
jgi:DNA-binding CsgD family transcriptional regulator